MGGGAVIPGLDTPDGLNRFAEEMQKLEHIVVMFAALVGEKGMTVSELDLRRAWRMLEAGTHDLLVQRDPVTGQYNARVVALAAAPDATGFPS